jgi:hypothetical protein
MRDMQKISNLKGKQEKKLVLRMSPVLNNVSASVS